VNVIHRVFREDHGDEIARAWSLIHPLPFDVPVEIQDRPQLGPVILDRSDATAQAHVSTVPREAFPESDGEIGVIRITDHWTLRGERERAAVLLHELIHLRLFTGRLRANHDAMKATRRDIPPGREVQYDLADQLGQCVQEIACDRYAALRYPSFRGPYFDGERRGYYLQRDGYLVGGGEIPQLAAFFTLYGLIRAEAGLRVYEHDAGVVAELARLRERYRDELRRDCGGDDPLFARLCAAKDAIINVDVERSDRDENDYMELFRYVMMSL